MGDNHTPEPPASDETPKPNLAFNLPAKVGALVMLLAVGAFGLTLAVAAARAHQLLNLFLISLLIWGPIFCVIGWATRRALRIRNSRVPKEN